MGNQEPQQAGTPKSGGGIKGPLTFAVVAGVVAGAVTLIAATGGTIHQLRWDLGAIAFGVAFIATLLIASLLVMGHKENPETLGQGSGVSLKSSDRLEAARLAAAKAQEIDNATPKNDDGESAK